MTGRDELNCLLLAAIHQTHTTDISVSAGNMLSLRRAQLQLRRQLCVVYSPTRFLDVETTRFQSFEWANTLACTALS
jgi:hypothetical protein